MKTKGKIITILSGLIGVGIAYLIHFKLHYFGANHLTVETVLYNWLGMPATIASIVGFIVLYSEKPDNSN